MSIRIVRAVTYDVRFPTSETGDGSDALNAPDYSAAYVALITDRKDGLAGHGLTFTIGRGTEVCVAAIEALVPHVVGATLEELVADLGGLWRRLVGDTQLRWLGPEKGVIHLATAAIVNAVWDLYAKVEGKPLWKLLADLSPEQVVACIDFRYIDDALTPAEALDDPAPQRSNEGRSRGGTPREGFPAYTTSAGWLGYAEETLGGAGADGARGRLHASEAEGRGRPRQRPASCTDRARGDRSRAPTLARRQPGMGGGAGDRGHSPPVQLDPWWIEEPTSPDDILGHRRIREAVAPVRVATGEHVQNRVVFKQLLQLEAIDVCQLDCCRLGGINEVLAVLLLAAKFGVPVCPHAGGVGLCEYAQHVSMFDFVAVGASLDDRVCEFVDHLHEHFVNPVRVEGGRYIAPATPGCSVEIRPESLAEFAFPDGTIWWQRRERAEAYLGEAGRSDLTRRRAGFKIASHHRRRSTVDGRPTWIGIRLKESVRLTADSHIQPLDQSRLGEEVAQMLRRAIISGELDRGHISWRACCRSASTSAALRSEKRLRELESEGLVESRRRGVYVKGLTPADVWELYNLRTMLEGAAVQLAVSRFDKSDIAALRGHLETMAAAAATGRRIDFAKADMGFHTELFERIGHRRLLRVWQSFVETYRVILEITDIENPDLEAAVVEHRHILDAIERRDAEDARRRDEESLLNGQALFERRFAAP